MIGRSKDAAARGRRLRQARRVADLTQEEVASALGVHSVTVSNWERGQEPDLETLWRLAGLYRTPVGYLTFGDVEASWPQQHTPDQLVLPPAARPKRGAKKRAG